MLTFDDGPLPAVTKPILDTLDKFCTKATFFSVGRMAIAFPATSRTSSTRGHTLGGHTWSHANLKAIGFEKARTRSSAGFAAVALAAGQPIAPFFRFPYLNDTDPLLGHLQIARHRGVYGRCRLQRQLHRQPRNASSTTRMRDTIARDGGILLFHDIKSVTAKALPEILPQLKDQGFKVVHMRAKAPLYARD